MRSIAVARGEKRLALGVFIAPALPAHLPFGSWQRLSRKAGKKPVKRRARYTKPPGNPAKPVGKRPFCSSARKVAFGFGGNRRVMVKCSAFMVAFSELLERDGKFWLRCRKSKTKRTSEGCKVHQEDRFGLEEGVRDREAQG